MGLALGWNRLDVCGLAGGELWLDQSWPVETALGEPDMVIGLLSRLGPLDLVVAPLGYGLPLVPAAGATDEDLRLALLGPDGDGHTYGALLRRIAAAGLPLVYPPGVMHLASVPDHRKLNHVDLGGAAVVCVAALALAEQAARLGERYADAAFILLVLGGSRTAAIAVEGGCIVDGIGGSSGPIGWEGAGALDGEVAFLAREVTKGMLAHGGVTSVANEGRDRLPLAFEAFVEGALKAVRQLQVSAPTASEVLLAGPIVHDPAVRERLAGPLVDLGPVSAVIGFAGEAHAPAQGAALLADGLAGGTRRELVDALRLRESAGTALDHLYVVPPAEARQRLGLGPT